ncbi:hypothetical protein Dimus_032900 [Dionaea muscipula]
MPQVSKFVSPNQEVDTDWSTAKMESDGVIVDLETLSNGVDTDLSSNSRIMRSLPRKGITVAAAIARGGAGSDKTIIIPSHEIDRDTPLVYSSSSSSPSSAPPAGENSKFEKPKASDPPCSKMVAMDTCNEQQNNNQVIKQHHHITIRAANIGAFADAHGRLNDKKYIGIRRRPPAARPWFFDPRRILLLFATLSTVGSMLLILFMLLLSA